MADIVKSFLHIDNFFPFDYYPDIMKAVILVSGGIDSCVAAAIANEEHDLAFLHANYGQRTQERELKAFNKISDFYKVKEKLICELNWLKEIGGSSLTDKSIPIPQGSLKSKKIPSTYVPFRNAILLSIATSWAETINADCIFIGAVAQDNPNYPDTQPEFFKIFNKLVQSGTKPRTNIKILTPLNKLQKHEIIKLGFKLGAPLNLTWSCYKNSNTPCTICDACIRRKNAFKLAGLKDPAL